MGQFDLSMPQHGSRFSLGDFQLRLDPQIEAAIRSLQSQPPTPALRNLFVRPNWAAMQNAQLQALLRQAPATAPPLVPRGKGPATPRPAQVTDLLSAIWAIPSVSQASNRVLDSASQNLRRDWTRLSTGHRALVISHGVVLVGGSLTAIMSNSESRTFVLDLIADQHIPVPGVSGLTFQVNPRGGGARYRNIGGSGVTVGGSGGVDQSGGAQYKINVSLDVVRFIDVLK